MITLYTSVTEAAAHQADVARIQETVAEKLHYGGKAEAFQACLGNAVAGQRAGTRASEPAQ